MALTALRLPSMEHVRKMEHWADLVQAVKDTKLSSGRNFLSHHMTRKGAPDHPIESLASIGFSNFKATPGTDAGVAMNFMFPALFSSPRQDQQTFVSEGGCVWRYDGFPTSLPTGFGDQKHARRRSLAKFLRVYLPSLLGVWSCRPRGRRKHKPGPFGARAAC